MCPKKLTAPQAVLFDLDGTVLDTARDLGETLNRLLVARDLPSIAYSSYRPIASHGAYGLLRLGFADLLSEPEIEQMRAEFLASYEANISLHTRLFDGMPAVIDKLNAASIPWGIVTNKPAFLTDQLLPHYPELANCAVVVSGDTLAQRKPDPAPLLYACDQISVDPLKCWYVGDAWRDIEAGRRANMQTVLAAWGYTQDKIPMHEWQADVIIEHPSAMLNLF